MKALVGAFNQEKALVGAFSVIVQPVVEPMDRFAALVVTMVIMCCWSGGRLQERQDRGADGHAGVPGVPRHRRHPARVPVSGGAPHL